MLNSVLNRSLIAALCLALASLAACNAVPPPSDDDPCREATTCTECASQRWCGWGAGSCRSGNPGGSSDGHLTYGDDWTFYAHRCDGHSGASSESEPTYQCGSCGFCAVCGRDNQCHPFGTFDAYTGRCV